MQLLIVCPLVFLASFLDSICGGGGLVSIPAYTFAGFPMTAAIATNKLSAAPAATASTIHYAVKGKVDWIVIAYAVIPCMVLSSLGAHVAETVPEVFLRIFLIAMMPPLAAFVAFKDKIHAYLHKGKVGVERGELKGFLKVLVSILTGGIIGFYDGFFGPGTGLFLTFSFMYIMHLDVIRSAGTARFLNATSGIFSLIQFIFLNQVNFYVGIPAAFSGICGALLGSSLTLKNGKKIMKPIMLLVITIMFVKLLIDAIRA